MSQLSIRLSEWIQGKEAHLTRSGSPWPMRHVSLVKPHHVVHDDALADYAFYRDWLIPKTNRFYDSQGWDQFQLVLTDHEEKRIAAETAAGDGGDYGGGGGGSSLDSGLGSDPKSVAAAESAVGGGGSEGVVPIV